MGSPHSALTEEFLHEPKGIATAAAGTTYVADGAGSGAWTVVPGDTYSTATVVRLTAASLTNSTLAADDTLFFAVEANSQYQFQFSIAGTAAPTNDFKISFNLPTGATLIGGLWYRNEGGTTVNGNKLPNHSLGESQVVGTDFERNNIIGEGVLITSSTSGFLTVMRALNSGASGSISAGSYVDYQKVV